MSMDSHPPRTGKTGSRIAPPAGGITSTPRIKTTHRRQRPIPPPYSHGRPTNETKRSTSITGSPEEVGNNNNSHNQQRKSGPSRLESLSTLPSSSSSSVSTTVLTIPPGTPTPKVCTMLQRAAQQQQQQQQQRRQQQPSSSLPPSSPVLAHRRRIQQQQQQQQPHSPKRKLIRTQQFNHINNPQYSKQHCRLTKLVLQYVKMNPAVTADLLELLYSATTTTTGTTNTIRTGWEFSLELEHCTGRYGISNLLHVLLSSSSSSSSQKQIHIDRICLIRPPTPTVIALGKELSQNLYFLKELQLETKFSTSMALALAKGLQPQQQQQQRTPCWVQQSSSSESSSDNIDTSSKNSSNNNNNNNNNRQKKIKNLGTSSSSLIHSQNQHHCHRSSSSSSSSSSCLSLLKCLNLSHSSFETSQVFHILVQEGIAKNTTLEILHLTGCHLEDDEIEFLVYHGLIPQQQAQAQDSSSLSTSSSSSSSSSIQELYLAMNFCQAKAMSALFGTTTTTIAPIAGGSDSHEEEEDEEEGKCDQKYSAQDSNNNNIKSSSYNSNEDNNDIQSPPSSDTSNHNAINLLPHQEPQLQQHRGILYLRRLDISQQDVWDDRSYLEGPLTQRLAINADTINDDDDDDDANGIRGGLEALNLADNFLTDQHMEWLAPALAVSPVMTQTMTRTQPFPQPHHLNAGMVLSCLTDLDLHGNSLTDTSLQLLADHVLPCPWIGIKNLNLSHNSFSRSGVQVLVRGLSVNISLHHILIWSDEELEQQQLSWNQLGRQERQSRTYEDYDGEDVMDRKDEHDDMSNDGEDHCRHSHSTHYCLTMIDYYCRLNRGGRYLLRDNYSSSNISIPVSLWPRVLHRCSIQTTTPSSSSWMGLPLMSSSSSDNSNDNQIGTSGRNVQMDDSPQSCETVSAADVLYFMLRHGPVLF